MQEREFVKQENAQLRLAVKGLFKAGSQSTSKEAPVTITVNISATEKKARSRCSCPGPHRLLQRTHAHPAAGVRRR
eukprot:1881735-Prymnesium_polylepis.1